MGLPLNLFSACFLIETTFETILLAEFNSFLSIKFNSNVWNIYWSDRIHLNTRFGTIESKLNVFTSCFIYICRKINLSLLTMFGILCWAEVNWIELLQYIHFFQNDALFLIWRSWIFPIMYLSNMKNNQLEMNWIDFLHIL